MKSAATANAADLRNFRINFHLRSPARVRLNLIERRFVY
jgi:hypothetical protein